MSDDKIDTADDAPDLFIFKAHLRKQHQVADGTSSRTTGRSRAGAAGVAGNAAGPVSSTADLRVNEVLEELDALLSTPASAANSPSRRGNQLQRKAPQHRVSGGTAAAGDARSGRSNDSSRRSTAEKADMPSRLPIVTTDKDMMKLWRRSSMDSSRDEILAHLKLVGE